MCFFGIGLSIGLSYSGLFSWRRTIYNLKGISYVANFGFSLFGISIGIGLFFDSRGFAGINFGVGISAFKYGEYSGVCVTTVIPIKGKYIGYDIFKQIRGLDHR